MKPKSQVCKHYLFVKSSKNNKRKIKYNIIGQSIKQVKQVFVKN